MLLLFWYQMPSIPYQFTWESYRTILANWVNSKGRCTTFIHSTNVRPCIPYSCKKHTNKLVRTKSKWRLEKTTRRNYCIKLHRYEVTQIAFDLIWCYSFNFAGKQIYILCSLIPNPDSIKWQPFLCLWHCCCCCYYSVFNLICNCWCLSQNLLYECTKWLTHTANK